jgi:4'-phosphopantetheinyl transferase
MAAGARPLFPGTVDIWWCDLRKSSPSDRVAWEEAASADDRDRAQRFRFPADRERFLAGRGLLRALLAGYIGERSEDLRFARDAKGKPRLPDGDIGFNLSRTEGGVLIGFARGNEIGVDVERVKDGYAEDDIAGRFFAPAEVASLAELPESERSEAFFRIWTAKEAYLKARGDGLGYPLDAFAVPLGESGPGRLRWHRDEAEAERWWLAPLTPSAGFVATVAVEGRRPELILREAPAS